MTWLAVLLTLALGAIALLHLAWALGFWWPIADEAELARTVVGAKDIDQMPGAVACSFVVVALMTAAIWPWYMAEGSAPFGRAGGWAIGAVFVLRGVVAFSPQWQRKTPEHPFTRLDRRFYAPLCLGLGVLYFLYTGTLS